MSSPLYTAALVNTTFFGIYGNAVKGMLHISGNQITAKPSLGIVTVAGVVGGAVQVLVSCPVDLVKIKLQMQGTSGEFYWINWMTLLQISLYLTIMLFIQVPEIIQEPKEMAL